MSDEITSSGRPHLTHPVSSTGAGELGADAAGLRVALLGTGSMAVAHLAAWRALGAEVVAWSPRSAEDFAARHGLRAASSAVEAIAAADVVDVTTHTTTHLELVLAAVEAARPVVCEKPLARTTDDARAIFAAAAEAAVPVFPAHVVRHMAPYAALHRGIDACASVAAATFTRVGATPAARSWFTDDAASGGILLDFLIHDYDQALWLLGDVVSVEAAQTPATVAGIVPAEVDAVVRLTHTSGAVSHIKGAWMPEGTPFSSTAELRLVDGSTRTASVGAAARAEPDAAEDAPHIAQLRDVVRSIRTGSAPVTPLVDGVAAVRVAEASHEAAATGRPVVLT